MNKNDIELLSVKDLEKQLALNHFLFPYINTNDKEPSWDGYTYLFRNKGKQKKDIYGRAHVQVKGKFQKDHSKQRINYPVEVVDLKNYLTDGGVIFFVIYINEEGDTRIYYSSLEPNRIKSILKKVKENQLTKTIKFKSLPNNQEKIKEIFFNFCLNSSKQTSFANDKTLTIEELESKYGGIGYELTFQGFGLTSEKKVSEFVKLNNGYIYAKVPGIETFIPVEGEVVDMIPIREENKNISVNNKIFYQKFSREQKPKKTILHFSKNVFVTVIEEENLFNLSYKDSGMLYETINDLEFFITVIDHKGFYIDDLWIDLKKANLDSSEFDTTVATKRLLYLQEITVALNYLNIDADMDLSKLNHEQIQDLNILRIAFTKKQVVSGLKKNMPTFAILSILDLKLALIFLKQSEGTYKILDHFQTKLWAKAFDENNNEHPTSIYSPLTAENLAIIDNIRFDRLLLSFQELHFDENVLHESNLFMLKIIQAADLLQNSVSDRKNELLKSALDFSNWIIEMDKQTNFLELERKKINHFQIKKRLGRLSKDNQLELLQLAENNLLDHDLRLGAYILIDYQLAAEQQFNELNEKKQQSLSQYPISYFFKFKQNIV